MEDDLWWKMTFDGRQPLMDGILWWKTNIVTGNIWWKTTFDGRQHLMEDRIWWKTTFEGRQHLIDIWWKTTFDRSLIYRALIINCAVFFFKNCQSNYEHQMAKVRESRNPRGTFSQVRLLSKKVNPQYCPPKGSGWSRKETEILTGSFAVQVSELAWTCPSLTNQNIS